jgi:hypothetical protein
MANLSYDFRLDSVEIYSKTLEDELRKSILENDIKSLKKLIPKVTENTEINFVDILTYVAKFGCYDSLLTLFEHNIKNAKVFKVFNSNFLYDKKKTIVDLILDKIFFGSYSKKELGVNYIDYVFNDRYKMMQLAFYNNDLGTYESIGSLAYYTSTRCPLKNLPVHFLKQMTAYILFTNTSLINRKEALKEFIYSTQYLQENLIIEMTIFYIKNAKKINLLYCFDKKNINLFALC